MVEQAPQGRKPPAAVPPQKLRGWITPAFRAILGIITFPTDRLLGSRLSLQAKSVDLEETSHRARRVDTFVAIAFVGELACYAIIVLAWKPWLQNIAAMLLAWRIIDIIGSAVRVSLFDRFEAGPATKLVVASHARIVVLGLVNYLEILLSFAGLYATIPDCLQPSSQLPPIQLPRDWLAPLYFSAITQFTVGYGDIAPIGIARGVVLAQGMGSLLLLMLIVGRFVSLLRPERSLDESVGPDTGPK